MSKKGKVYLVGAGPGDPGLITLKAIECLAEADVVVYDNLANRAFLKYAPDTAELIYVGKKGGHHTLAQNEINRLIVQKALSGKKVVRLKGGDPFIFGRGGEEAEELMEAGVEFEVVPGITSAIAAPAYAGIPLTHRHFTSTVAFVTGHEDPTKEKSSIAWEKIATGVGTLVFLMGVGNLEKIAAALMAHGRDPSTPVAVVRRGTEPQQETVTGSLRDIATRARAAGIKPPSIIVVGDVVRLRDNLNWYETKPLFGKNIIVTRAREQASEFSRRLAELGANPIEFPAIEVVPPDVWSPLDRALSGLHEYDWVIFTSVNGVRFFLKRLRDLGRDLRALKDIRIAAIGPKTAEAWRRLHIEPDLVPQEYRAEAIVEEFKRLKVTGGKVLVPRAEEAREVLPGELGKMGFSVDVVSTYKTVRPDQSDWTVRDMLEQGQIDMVTFTSSSTVRNFVSMFEMEEDKLRNWMKHVTVACIGPITADTARRLGFSVDVMPEEYTTESLVSKIVDYWQAP
ncbi:MAG: uroporphyrinogen-III C-methyltransferase [Deltaproteobacteria bacterium]|nr:MAG: uroporphyrinogen-III C-methyltransferase [Deltaproteobacteria bacterium]